MTAKNLYRVNESGIYSHIYNKGIESKIVFSDSEDYQAFIGFLSDYLSTPVGIEAARRDFTVNGRVFRGVPHRLKNYFGKIELLAYRLSPNSFNLLVHQVAEGSIENFVRSLCTRYSIYFNKKYQRAGNLFERPYKSAQIKDETQLL